MSHNRPVTMAEVKRLLELVAAGHKRRTIARLLGRARSTVSTYWRRYGEGPMRRQHMVTPEAEAEVLRLARRGHHGAEIARRLGLAPSTVSTIKRRLGVPVPDGRRLPRAGTGRAGWQAMYHARLDRDAARCREMGWPGARTVSGARILTALERTPSLTEAGIALALGWAVNARRQNGLVRVRLRELLACGLVVRVQLRRPGEQRWSWRYSVSPVALARRKEAE
jgi:DNA-binding CsgD family transcriptional regulator